MFLKMMKLIFLTFFFSQTPILFSVWALAFTLFLITNLTQLSLPLTPEMDFLSLSLVLLSVWLAVLMVMANYQSKNMVTLISLIKLLVVFLTLSFFSSSFFAFYLFFEASLIPIFWIILGWGYQPERMAASMTMFFYTLASSFPLLAALFLIWFSSFSVSMTGLFFDVSPALSPWISISLMLAFLVKFPMFLVHLWLPKAHVEAPVSGSMILAGVLLKLGGYGLYRLSPLFGLSQMNSILMIISVAGGSLLGLLCCRLSDMKVIIAYSSVVHMALIILALLGLESMSIGGIWWVMLAHGLVSSGLFAGANMMYEQSHSRSLLINKGVLSLNPSISVFWFILLMSNFGGPFTLNLYGEINLILSALASSSMFFLPVAMLAVFSAAYSLILYASSQQGSPAFSGRVTNKESLRELVLLWGHSWPILILLLNLSI